jgi:2-oxo-4-hydroxy-4-carboxy-5-ureidoimidazoline decarboxylase
MAVALSAINAMPLEAFLASFGDVAEHSPWVAERAFVVRPFSTRDGLIAAFEAALHNANRDEKLALIRAHPDLATKARLTDDSSREQAGAGLNTLTAEEFARFTDLNTAYKQRFGFPFIFAVKGASKHMILEAFAERVRHSAEAEFATAIEQVARIFRFRLEDRVAA